jgi:sulfonate transport system permease protein
MRISAWRLFWGFVAGTGFGLPLGLVLGLWSPARDYLLPSFKIIAQVPILGWIPLLMMLVGIDEALKIIIIAKAVCVPTTLNTCKGMQGVPSLWIEVAKVYRFSRWQLLKKVVAPAAFPQIWAGIRYGLTHGWLALVVVELLASSEGLGFLIVYGRQLFQLDTVLAAVVVVGSVGWSLDKFLSLTEARLLRWRREAF